MNEERRKKIIRLLSESSTPVSGSSLAKRLQVSRQVIVQDVAILRARGNGVMATPQGYLLPPGESAPPRAVLAVQHRPAETGEELNIMVDHGLKVLDVLVEHPLYGELKGYLMLESRKDVKNFVERVEAEGAVLLSALTKGIHLHTVEYRKEDDLKAARLALGRKGFLAAD